MYMSIFSYTIPSQEIQFLHDIYIHRFLFVFLYSYLLIKFRAYIFLFERIHTFVFIYELLLAGIVLVLPIPNLPGCVC